MEKAERNRGTANRILDSAEELLRSLSFQGLRMGQLSDRMGLSRKTLYNHFPGGKREIWRRCIERRMEGFASRLFQITGNTDGDYVDRARQLLDIGREAMVVFYGPGGLIPATMENQILFPDIRVQYTNGIASFLKEGINKNFIKKGLPVRSLAGALVTLIGDWGRPESLMRNGECRNIPEFIQTVLLEGIVTEEGRRNLKRLG